MCFEIPITLSFHSLTDTIFLLYLLMYALGKEVLVPRASPVNAELLVAQLQATPS